MAILFTLFCLVAANSAPAWDHHPLSKIGVEKITSGIDASAKITAYTVLLGLEEENNEWITVEIFYPYASGDDWVGVFSPAKFNSSTCPMGTDPTKNLPHVCTAPVKFAYVKDKNPGYQSSGKATVKFLIINQRADFSFALFAGGLSSPKLVAVSNPISFLNPKAPLYPRLAQGKSWNEVHIRLSACVFMLPSLLLFVSRVRVGCRKLNMNSEMKFERNQPKK